MFNDSKKKLGGLINSVLQGTHDHYLSYLPEKFGYIAPFLLSVLFSGIKVNRDPSIVKKFPKDCIIVYATKYKSYLDYLFYHERFKTDDLPCPEIGFGYKPFFFQPLSRIFRVLLSHIDYFRENLSFPDPYISGYYTEELLNGKSALLSLIDRKGFYLRYVKSETGPLQHLIKMQKTIDRPIMIIPLLFFFTREPQRSELGLLDIFFGSKEKPGKIRRIFSLLKPHNKLFTEISEPLNLKNFLDLSDIKTLSTRQQEFSLRHHLISQINRHRQSIIGPTLKSREELKQNILTGNKLQSYMESYAQLKKMPISEVHKKADSHLDEIAANYNQLWIKVYDLVLRSIVKTMFEGIIIDQEGLAKVKQMSKKGPLILIPCHKSHLDYLIISFIFYHNNLACPHIAAGKNLSFWPMGTIFRGGGAFFLRRTFKGARLYAKVFTAYIDKLLEEGFNIEVFIEGGRSRTGKLLSPKLGLLSIILNAFREGACEDLIFVPIFIGYDKVLEENAYLHELSGGQKKPEDLKQVIRARKLLKNRYGKIYIRFSDPISINEHLAKEGAKLSEMPSKEVNSLIRYLGYKFINAINDVSVVTPYGLVASAILNSSKTRFSYEQLKHNLETYMNYLVSTNVKLADTIIMDHTRAYDHVLETFTQRKFIENNTLPMIGESTEIQYEVPESKRPGLDYYKNNCIALFIPAAFTALSILSKDAFLFSASDLHPHYKFLSEFFINEFSYNVDSPAEFFVRRTLKAFINDAIVIPHPTLPDTYNLTSSGYRKLNLFAGFLKTYFESYWVVLKYYMQTPKSANDPKDRVKKIHTMSSKMYKNKEIERSEALSKITFMNADHYFTSHGIHGAEDEEKIKQYADTIQKYLSYFQP